ncbi:MAG TPA: efflux RND transporter periplasmic adaptor subunit [Hydrogenophaga sp.]|nr:efflux RND transporter periplasmic adaptor subunit [Hydrogenophaga sp.]
MPFATIRISAHLPLVVLILAMALPCASGQAQSTTPTATTEPAAPARTSVETSTLDQVWLLPKREAPANVVARNESKLAAEVSGTLMRWGPDVGASVKRGELLAQIDPRDHELAVQRAQASLNASQARLKLAQAQLQRSRELVAQGFFSREALAQRETEVALVQTEVNSARAQLASEQRQLAKTRLRAPFAGTVRERMAQTGEAVAPGTVLYVLVETGHNEVNATLSPADVAGLRRATDLKLHTREGEFPVRLLRVAETVTAPARTQAARLAFVDTTHTPAAGASGTLRWQERQPHLPPSLMVRRDGALGVFVVQGEGAQATARFVPVPGAQESRATPSPASLDGNVHVVARGQEALQNGQAIEPRPAVQ